MANGGDNPILLPPEIIINILKWLPIKSIIRFQSVCKDWQNLIKTPFFVAEHARHSAHQEDHLLLIIEFNSCEGKPPSLRLVNHMMETVQVLSMPSITDFVEYDTSIVGSCNGLLCVQVFGDLHRGPPSSLYLWNPMIRQIRKLPQTATKDYHGLCNPGLGFSSIVNDYKIVKFYKKELRKNRRKQRYCVAQELGHHGAEVYSLSTGSWKELEFEALKNTTIISTAANADGTIVWLGVRDSFHVVVSFDIAREVFTLSPTPMPFHGHDSVTLGVYRNKLAAFVHLGNGSFNSIDSWVMEEVASESGKSFNCTEVYNFSLISWFFQPLCIWRNQIVCHDEDQELGCESKFTLRMFNISTKEWKEFCHFFSGYRWSFGCNYERSLSVCLENLP